MKITSMLPVLTLTVCFQAHAYQVIGITDGDTLTLLVDRKPLKVRLAYIDAPEKRQPFGNRSKENLAAMCFGKEASYRVIDIDRYGRTVAEVTCDTVNVNRAQVERGMAWVYTKYNRDASLPAVELASRHARRGLWVDPGAMPPWEFRAMRKK